MIDAAGTHVIYEVKHLEKSFGKVEVLKDINIQIGNGEVLTIIGPSGSGKSTFLRCLNLLEKPTGGELWFDGRLIDGKTDVKMLRRDVGMVFQSFNLFPMFSAVENVMYAPVHINKLDKKQAKEEAMELLSRVGMADRANHYPGELSGGQQQRVAVARALVMNPEVLLLDEPLSNLDAKLRESVRVELRDIQKKMGLSTIYVTHDQSEALSMSDMIVVLKGGVVHQTGSPQEIYFEPKTPFVADFIGTTNLLSVKGLGENTVSYGNDRIPTTKSVNAGQEYCLSIRPECLKLVKEAVDGQVNVKVTIQNKMFLGEKIRYFVNDSLGKEWIIDIYDPGRTILEGEAYAAFPFEKAWLIEDLTD